MPLCMTGQQLLYDNKNKPCEISLLSPGTRDQMCEILSTAFWKFSSTGADQKSGFVFPVTLIWCILLLACNISAKRWTFFDVTEELDKPIVRY